MKSYIVNLERREVSEVGGRWKGAEGYALLLELSKLRLHFLQIRMLFPLLVGKWLLDHEKLVQLVRDIKVSLVHLQYVAFSELELYLSITAHTSGTNGGCTSLFSRFSQSIWAIQG